MSRMIPRGHEVAGLGRRFLAYLIDVAPVAIFSGLLALALNLWGTPTVVLVASITATVLTLGYGLYQWWSYSTRGAGLGARATGLELVGLTDGKPIGWWRVILRFLVFLGLWITVIGGIAFLVFLIIHERRQGWHDMAVGSVLVQPRPAAASSRSASKARKPVASTVGLPPHLADQFSPEAAQTSAAWGPQPEQQQWQPQQEPWREPEGWGSPQQPAPQTPFPGTHVSGAPYSGPQSQPSHPGGFGGMPPSSGPSASGFPQSQPSGPVGFPSAPTQDQGGHAMPPTRTQQPGWIPMPTPSSVLEPSQKSVRVRPRDFGEVDDDGTVIAALPHAEGGRAGDEGWYLRLDDGREVDMTVTVLLGRNPQRGPQDPEVQLVPSSGDGRMISRTHVLIGTDLRGVYVVDRGSTNGTALVTDTGELEPAPTGVQMRVREGQQVSYGNRWFTVLRRPAQAK